MLILLTLFAPASQASTIAGVALERMLEDSSLVFEGVVTEHESAFETPEGSIRTCLLFEVSDVIKGDDPGDTLRLCFSGGTVDGLTLEVTGSEIPKTGERGIYFVESTQRRLVNPLFGWSQGHFRIESVSGGPGVPGKRAAAVDRVVTERGRPVVDLETDASPHGARLSSGVAAGVVEGESDDAQKALSPEAFKDKLRGLLGELPQ